MPATDDRDASPRGGDRRATARAVAGLLVALIAVQVGWLTLVAPFGAPDEFDHAYRASAAANGHWGASDQPAEDGRGALVRADADVVAAAFAVCDALDYTGPDNCRAVSEPDEQGEVLVASAAATYNPVWYVVVGTLASPFDGDGALVAMRVWSMLLCGVVLAWALVLLTPLLGTRWSVVAVLAAATPTLVWSTVAAAPNGISYAAAVVMWSALLRLASPRELPLVTSLAAWVVASLLVMSTHSTGLVWVALSALCALPALLRGRLGHLDRAGRRATAAAVALVAAGAVACLAWIVQAGTNDPWAETNAGGNGPATVGVLLRQLLLWPLQSLATLAYRNQPAPLGAYAVGTLVLGALVVAALLLGRGRDRLTILAVGALSLAVPTVATILTHDQLATAWQGRYGLPLSLGVLLVSAAVVADRLPATRVVAGSACLAWTVVQLIVLRGLAAATPDPPLPPLLVLGVVALLALAGTVVAALPPADEDGRERATHADAARRPGLG